MNFRSVAVRRASRVSCKALIISVFAVSSVVSPLLHASASGDKENKEATDTLRFTNGDMLTGSLLRGDSSEVVFKSTMLGEVHVPWSKIAELKTSHNYVVLSSDSGVARGPVAADGKQIDVSYGNDRKMAVDKTVMIVDTQTYDHTIAPSPELWEAWTGTLAAGVNLVEATQSQRSYTGDVKLVRNTPRLSWLAPKERTTVNFHGNFGKLTQPGTPTVRTDLYHGLFEQDEFFSKRLFAYGSMSYDHDIAQGLSLQQAYGGGVGFKLVQRPVASVELKGDLHYTRQNFDSTELENAPYLASTDNLLASTFSLVATRKFPHGTTWTANVSASPAYNYVQAFQASGSSVLSFPVYRALSLNFSLFENYLNNPQPGFRRNSLQFTSGFQFAFR